MKNKEYPFIKFLESNETTFEASWGLDLIAPFEDANEAMNKVKEANERLEVVREQLEISDVKTDWELIWFKKLEESELEMSYDRYRGFLVNVKKKILVITSWKYYFLNMLSKEFGRINFGFKPYLEELGGYRIYSGSDMDRMFDKMKEELDEIIISKNKNKILRKGRLVAEQQWRYVVGPNNPYSTERLDNDVQYAIDKKQKLIHGKFSFSENSKWFYKYSYLSKKNAISIILALEDKENIKRLIIEDCTKRLMKDFEYECLRYYERDYKNKRYQDLLSDRDSRLDKTLVVASAIELNKQKLPEGQLALAL